MAEIKPMLLSETFDKSVLDDSTKMFQIKENGTRAIVHVIDGKVVGIRNRSNAPVLYLFPELRDVKIPFKNAILDGELCVVKDGKSVFYGGVDKRRSIPDKKVMEEYPAKLILFDALMIDSTPLVMKPYKERYNALSVIPETDRVAIAKVYNDGKALWDKVVKENQEGVVIKNPMAAYELDTRSKNYIKLKNYKTTDVVVSKSEPNSKGIKMFGKTTIDGKEIEVEVQLGGVFDIEIGSVQTIKYLDICGSRLIQPTKISREQKGGIENGR